MVLHLEKPRYPISRTYFFSIGLISAAGQGRVGIRVISKGNMMDFNQLMVRLSDGFRENFGERVAYSVKHMNLTQWGIFAFACLTVGVLALRGRKI